MDEVYMDLTQPIANMFSASSFFDTILPFVCASGLMLAGEDSKELRLEKGCVLVNDEQHERDDETRAGLRLEGGNDM